MAGFCKECGNALADGAKFCTKCGSAVEPVTAATTAATAQTAPIVAPTVAATPTPTPAPIATPVYQAPVADPAVTAAPSPPPAAAPIAAEPMATVRTQNNTAMLVGGGAGLIALAGLAAYFLFSKPETASLDANSSAATNTQTAKTETVPAGMEPIAGATPIAGQAPPGQTVPGQVVPGQPIAGAPPVAPGAQSGAPVGQSVIKYAGSAANIRDIATAEAPSRIVGSLKRGASVQGQMHVGLSGSTYWFKLADGRGFVSAVNLVDAPPPAVVAAPAPPRPPVASGPLCSVIDRTGSNLRIRNAPNGGVIGGMPNGIQLRWLGEASDGNGALWYRVDPVQSGYPTGWVYADHVAC